MVKGVKLVMCNIHDQDTCHYMSGEFEGKASTWVEAKLCPNEKELVLNFCYFYTN